jgi:hypothetical protein
MFVEVGLPPLRAPATARRGQGRRPGAPRAQGAVALLLGAALSLPTAAAAFSAQGHRWPNQQGEPVSYRLDPAGAPDINDDSELAAVRRAFATWENVACSYLSFREEPWIAPQLASNDTVNRVFWTAQWPADQRTTIALTFTFYRTTDRIVTDADIAANASYYQWTTTDGQASQTKVDVETIIFHEIGHFFGLDHSTDPNAAMFPSNNKLTQRAPAQDDVNGICALYPGAPNTGGNTTSGGVGAPCRNPEDCQSSLCAQDGQLGVNYCTASCDSTAPNPGCPGGYVCTRTGQGDFCLAPPVTDELCDQCNDSTQCASGLCLNVPGYNTFQPFCTRACDPTNGVPGQCPNGFQCVAVFSSGITGGVCAPSTGLCNPRGRGGHNEPCFANGTCKAGNICANFFGLSGGPQYCYYECNTALVGVSCSETQAMLCLALSQYDSKRAACINFVPVGAPCMPEQCTPDAWCLFDERLGVDSAACYRDCGSQACPANSQCQNVAGAGQNPLLVCIPQVGFKPIGSVCASNEECVAESRSCKVFGDDRLCTKPCNPTDANACPAGTRCLNETGNTMGFCWPRSLTDDQNTPNDGRDVGIATTPVGYCACDRTNDCDSGCACDPDCTGGCSCEAASSGDARSALGSAWASVVFAAAAWALRGARRARGAPQPSTRQSTTFR